MLHHLFENRCFALAGRLLPLLAALGAVSCQQAVEEEPGPITRVENPVIYASNYPMYYFTKRIVGEMGEVVYPVPADRDPLHWRPDEETVRQMQRADFVILNGAGYEAWLTMAALPPRILVNTALHFERNRLIEVPGGITHSHGDGGTHTHAATATTTWLDPSLAIEHARSIRDAMTRLMPRDREGFIERHNELAADLESWERELKEVFQNRPGAPLLASQPVYQYLEDRYSLNLRSLDWEPGEMPLDGEWTALDRLLEEHAAEWMLWVDDPLPEVASRLDERGIAVVVFRPCSRPPSEGDFLTEMRANTERLREAFAP